MIDVENKVYDEVRTAILASHSSVTIKSIPDYTPKAFPTVEFSQVDSFDTSRLIDSSGADYADITFMLTIYTKGSSRKKDAKAILSTATDKLHLMNFTLKSNVGYAYNDDTYRIDARYEATASNNTIFRR